MQFNGVMLGSDQPDVLGEFYANVLGEPSLREGPWGGWEGKANLMLGAHSDVSGRNTLPQRIMLTLEVDDVPRSFAEITSLGARVVAEPYHPEEGNDMMLATGEDADGRYVQLAPPWTDM